MTVAWVLVSFAIWVPKDTYGMGEKQRGISGGSRGEAQGARPPLPPSFFLDQAEARRAEKIFFWDRAPLSPALDDRPHPPPPPLIWRSGSANGHDIITRLFSIVGSPLASKIFTLEKILQLPPTNKQGERFTSCENFVLAVPDLTSPHPWHYLFSL